MKKLAHETVRLLRNQPFVLVCSHSSGGTIHCSAKGVGYVDPAGKVYLIDLYLARTFMNIKNNPAISITVVNENEFTGYTLKGKANILGLNAVAGHILKKWQQRVTERISRRVIKNIKTEKRSVIHPESRFPHPEYVIEVTVSQVIDLAPAHLKKSIR